MYLCSSSVARLVSASACRRAASLFSNLFHISTILVININYLAIRLLTSTKFPSSSAVLCRTRISSLIATGMSLELIASTDSSKETSEENTKSGVVLVSPSFTCKEIVRKDTDAKATHLYVCLVFVVNSTSNRVDDLFRQKTYLHNRIVRNQITKFNCYLL